MHYTTKLPKCQALFMWYYIATFFQKSFLKFFLLNLLLFYKKSARVGETKP